MVKNKVSLSILLVSLGVFVCQMSEASLADGAGDFQQARELETGGYTVMAKAAYEQVVQNYPGTDYALMARGALVWLISDVPTGKTAEVRAAIDRLIADFNDNPLLPAAVYYLGEKYHFTGGYESAGYIYQQVIQRWPDGEYGSCARLMSGEMKALASVEAGNDTAIDNAVNKLTADFANEPGLSGSLYRIGEKLEAGGDFWKAGEIYEGILERYPVTTGRNYPGQALARVNVKTLIRAGDYTGAKSDTDKLIADFGGCPGMAASLYTIGKQFEYHSQYLQARELYHRLIEDYPNEPQAGWVQADVQSLDYMLGSGVGNSSEARLLYESAQKYKEAQNTQQAIEKYQQIISQYPDSNEAGWARLEMSMWEVTAFIDAGKDANAEAAIERLRSDFAGNVKLGETILLIGEQYYYKGTGLENDGNNQQGGIYLQKAIDVWAGVINDYPGSVQGLQACLWTADSQRRLGDPTKAGQCYRKVVDEYPDCEFAWNSLFLLGRNYQELEAKGLMTAGDADANTACVYRQLLEKYPNCKAAGLAQRWLTKNSLE